MDDRAKGGWLDEKYNLMSWALSCLKAREFYPRVELVTDTPGKALFVDTLGLPYTACSTRLDELSQYPQDLWTVGKLFTYAIQDEPFIHIDGDVYFWEPLGAEIEQAPLVVQHLEQDLSFYWEMLQQILEKDFAIPAQLYKYFEQPQHLTAINAGIIGGQRSDFVNTYAQTALRFIQNNLDRLSEINISIFGVFVEQYFFPILAQEHQIPIKCYDPELLTTTTAYQKFNEIYAVPKRRTFVHMLGSLPKKDQFHCENLASRLRIEYPEYYFKIEAFIENNC